MSTRATLLLVFFVLAALVLSREAWLSRESAALVASAQARADRDVALEQAVNDVALHALDLETGVRGWVVSADPSFRDPYLRARSTLEVSLARLDAQVAGDEASVALAAEVRGRLAAWIADVATPLLSEKGPPQGDAAARSLEREGKRQMDGMRALLARLRERADAVHAEALAAAAGAVTRQRRHDLAAEAGLLGVIALVLLGLGLRIERPLTRLVGLAGQLDPGKLADVEVKATREVKELARALSVFAGRTVADQKSERRLSELRALASSAKSARELAERALSIIVAGTPKSWAVLWVSPRPGSPLAPFAAFGLDLARVPKEPPASVQDALSTRTERFFDDRPGPHFRFTSTFAELTPKAVTIEPVVVSTSEHERLVGVLELAGTDLGDLVGELPRLLPSLALALDKALAQEEVARLSKALDDERAQLESIFRALPDGLTVSTTAADRAVLRANPAAEKLLGPLVGRSSEELQKRLQVALADEKPGAPPPDLTLGPVRARATTPSGETRIISLSIGQILRADGTPAA